MLYDHQWTRHDRGETLSVVYAAPRRVFIMMSQKRASHVLLKASQPLSIGGFRISKTFDFCVLLFPWLSTRCVWPEHFSRVRLLVVVVVKDLHMALSADQLEAAQSLRTALQAAWDAQSPRPERIPDPTQFQMAPLGKRNAGSGLLCKAMAFYKTRWWERALKSLKDSIARYDKCALAYFYLGLTLAKLNKPEDRLAAYRKCIALDATHFDAHYNLGWMFHQVTKDMAGAETAYRAAIAACPNHTDAHFNLALILVSRGDTELAEKEFQLALESADKPEEVIQAKQEQQQPIGWNPAAIQGSNRRRSRGSFDDSPQMWRPSMDQRPSTPREPGTNNTKIAVAAAEIPANSDLKPQAPQEPKPSRSVSSVRGGRTQADPNGVASYGVSNSGEAQLDETRRGKAASRPRSARAGRRSGSLDSAPEKAMLGEIREPPVYHAAESAELVVATRPRSARGGRRPSTPRDSTMPVDMRPVNRRLEESAAQRAAEVTKLNSSSAQRNAMATERPVSVVATTKLTDRDIEEGQTMHRSAATASRPRSATGMRRHKPSDSSPPAVMVSSENHQQECAPVTDKIASNNASRAETSHYNTYDAQKSALASDTTGTNMNASAAQTDELPSPERSQLPLLANDESIDNRMLNRTTVPKKTAKGNKKHRSMTDFSPEGSGGGYDGEKNRVSFLLGKKNGQAGESNDDHLWESTRVLFGDATPSNEEPSSQNESPEEAEYKAAIERDASSAQARILYGSWLYLRKCDYDAAERQYNAACSVDPNSAEAYYNLGVLLDDVRKNYDEAERAYRRTIELNPKHTAAMNNYAVLLEQVRRDYGAAAKQYKAALEINPDDPDIRANYYACLRKRRGSN